MPELRAPMPRPAAVSGDSSRATPHLRTHKHKREARAPQNMGQKGETPVNGMYLRCRGCV
jgi:hypothetical protein